jgi:hypothetical protein
VGLIACAAGECVIAGDGPIGGSVSVVVAVHVERHRPRLVVRPRPGPVNAAGVWRRSGNTDLAVNVGGSFVVNDGKPGEATTV